MMVDVALKVTALLGAAWTVSFLLRRRAASTRHAVWSGLMAAALLLPVVGALAPSLELAWLPASPPGIQQPPLASGAGLDAVGPTGVELSAPAAVHDSAEAAMAERQTPRLTLTLPQVLAGAWLFVTLLFVIRIVVAHATARRMRDACVDPPLALVDALASVARELDVRVPPLRLAAAGTMPAVIGVLRPSVIVPVDALAWTAERLRLVLLHECAHVRRRDALLQGIASLATAAYWWHPLTWVAARRVVRERELACDDLVIATGTPGSAYASHLIDIARALKPSRQPAMAALAMARSSELEGRLIALLETRPRRSRPARALALGLGLALAALLAVAPLKLVAREAAPMPPVAQPAAIQLPAAHAPVGQAPGADVAAALPDAGAQAAAQQTPQVRASEQVDAAPAQTMKNAFTDALLLGLEDVDSDVRMMSLLALSRLERQESVPMLLRALEDADEDIRTLALDGLIRLEREEARAFLPRGLQDPSGDVRAMALIGLRRLNHPDRRALTIRAAADASEDVRTLAALALADEAGDDVDAMLVTLSKDPGPDVRRAALVAMMRKSRGLGIGLEQAVTQGLAHGVAQGIAQGVLQGVAQGVAGGLKTRDKQQ